ncbi:MAG TPA: hypothetical protein VE959_19250 [Bryobacteraceae bacterium]|nr:hypothetical protein [Bryobacteraceae bacterium]
MNYVSRLYELGALPVIRPGTTQMMTVGSSSTQSAAVNGTVARLVANVDCHILFGPSPVADTTCLFLPANTPEYFACYGTDLVAVICDSTNGVLYITPAVEA